jgi:hypothetical protein
MTEILKSESGKRMIGYVSPIYDQSRVMQAIFEANGREIDDLLRWIPDIEKQFFPQTATWGLKYWEQRLGLKTNEEIPIEERRNRVLMKLQTRWPMTPKRLETIISSIAGGITVKVLQAVDIYTFRVELENNDKPIDLYIVLETIDSTKPAHLSYEVGVKSSREIQVRTSPKRYIYRFPFVSELIAGIHPTVATIGRANKPTLKTMCSIERFDFFYKRTGTFLASTKPGFYKEEFSIIGKKKKLALQTNSNVSAFLFVFFKTGQRAASTEIRQISYTIGKKINNNTNVLSQVRPFLFNYLKCGQIRAGEVIA